jgi:hypothetical protein
MQEAKECAMIMSVVNKKSDQLLQKLIAVINY